MRASYVARSDRPNTFIFNHASQQHQLSENILNAGDSLPDYVGTSNTNDPYKIVNKREIFFLLKIIWVNNIIKFSFYIYVNWLPLLLGTVAQ